MNTRNDKELKQLGREIDEVDRDSLRLYKRRFRLCKKVARIKLKKGLPLSRPEIEAKRLNQISVFAKKIRINPEFARTNLYGVISESCKLQLAIASDFRLKQFGHMGE